VTCTLMIICREAEQAVIFIKGCIYVSRALTKTVTTIEFRFFRNFIIIIIRFNHIFNLKTKL
jgi:hypothetical protein